MQTERQCYEKNLFLTAERIQNMIALIYVTGSDSGGVCKGTGV